MSRVGNPLRPPVQADQGTAVALGLDPSLGDVQPIGGAAAASPAQGGAAATTLTRRVLPSVGDRLEAHLSADMDKLKAEAANLEKEKASAEKRAKEAKTARKSGETAKMTKARVARENRDEAKRIEEAKVKEAKEKEAKEKLLSPITASANRNRTQVQEGPEEVQPRDLSASLDGLLSMPEEELEDTQE